MYKINTREKEFELNSVTLIQNNLEVPKSDGCAVVRT